MKKLSTAIFLVLVLVMGATLVSPGSSLDLKETLAASAISSVQSGNWSEPSTWSGGTVPAGGDTVTISPNHNVSYDVLSDVILGPINIDGTLRFSRDTSTRLRTNDNILVRWGGVLDMGSPNDFIPQSVTAEIFWVLSQSQANSYVGGAAFEPTDKGLWAMPGSRWDVSGAPLMRAWSKLSQDAPPGAGFVIVENNVADWPLGGTVVISQTSNPATRYIDPNLGPRVSYRFEHELRTVAALEPFPGGATKITLDAPLSYLHEGSYPTRGEVGLLSRNVRFETEIVGVSESTLQQDVSARKFAHTLRMPGGLGDTLYAEFKYMGHYNRLARYPVHPHQMGESAQGMTIRGNGLWYTGFRWINIHSSSGVTVEDNVGFSSTASGYFSEGDFRGSGTSPEIVATNNDLVLFRNLGVDAIAVRLEDRFGQGEGIFNRLSVFWVGNSNGKAVLGNVAAGTRGGADSMGFNLPKVDLKQNPGFGEFFVSNEAHSITNAGLHSWQNRRDAFDLVHSLMWRNGFTGSFMGNYAGEFNIYNSYFYQNGATGVTSTITGAFVQDSVFEGSPVGWSIDAYFARHSPNLPHWNVRNTYIDVPVGFTHLHDACSSSTAEKLVETIACSADYSILMANTFQNVAKPLDFAWQPNANSWWTVFDSSLANLPSAFVAFRNDQLDPANQGTFSPKLINSQTFLSQELDALVTPMSSLPAAGVDYTGITVFREDGVRLPVYDVNLRTTRDLPPEIHLNVTQNGATATLSATATDDNAVTEIEIFADWTSLKKCSASTCNATYDLSQHPRKHVYFYARAFDGTSVLDHAIKMPDGSNVEVPYDQRAYSNVVELGPENILGQVPFTGPANRPPAVSAGQDQFFNLNSPAPAALAGTVSDDGLPSGQVSVQWSAAGPGAVSFADPASPNTNATFSAVGAYTLTLSASDGALSASDTVTITVNSGLNTQLIVSNPSALSGLAYTVVDGGLVDSALVHNDRDFTYTSVPASLAGATYIMTPNNDKANTAESFLSFSANQAVTVFVAYDVRASSLPNWLAGWTATGEVLGTTDVAHNLFSRAFADGQVTLGANQAAGAAGAGSNYTVIVVGDGSLDTPPPPTNQAPAVDAGLDQSVTMSSPATATLAGTVSDDGLPSGLLSFQWSASGPGTVVFTDPAALNTTAAFDTAGVYTLTLAATDGDLSADASITVTVIQPNQAPVVSAGQDQSVIMSSPATATLAGTVSDDGLPSGQLSGQWSASGPGTVAIADPAALNTTATFDTAGVYTLTLAASDGDLSAADSLSVTVIQPNQAPIVNAGADVTVTLPSAITLSGAVSDDGLPSGQLSVQWSASGPAPVAIADPAALNTTATFTLAGDSFLQLHASDGDLSAADSLSVTVSPPESAPGPLLISGLTAASGNPYEAVQDGLASGALVHSDRNFTYTSVPASLAGAANIKTANDDKSRAEEAFLSFSVNQPVTVYVAYDVRASSLPDWLSGWTATGETLGTTDVDRNLFSRDFASGQINLGANLATGASGASSNYTVVITLNSEEPAPDQLVISDLTAASGNPYDVVQDGLASGALVHSDRNFTYTSAPASLAGATNIKTANDDKSRAEEAFLSFSVNRAVTVYVAYDVRASSLPDWLSGWTATGETLGTTDVDRNLFSRDFASGQINLGANLAAGATDTHSNYTVVVVG